MPKQIRFTLDDIKRKRLTIIGDKTSEVKPVPDTFKNIEVKQGRPKLPTIDAYGYNEVQQHLAELHKDFPKVSIHKVPIKALSVNQGYTGKRWKTEKHREWKKSVLMLLPKIEMPAAPYIIYFIFGLSSSLADGDACVKHVQDIISERYKFNDKLIKKWIIEVDNVKKGAEYFGFCIDTYIK